MYLQLRGKKYREVWDRTGKDRTEQEKDTKLHKKEQEYIRQDTKEEKNCTEKYKG